MIKKSGLLVILLMLSACQINYVQVNNIASSMDFNDNGLDDYSDFVLGARKDANNHPSYNGDYVSKTMGIQIQIKGFVQMSFGERLKKRVIRFVVCYMKILKRTKIDINT